jgi:hypothetical protein
VALIFSHDPNVHPCSRRFKILEWLCYSPSWTLDKYVDLFLWMRKHLTHKIHLLKNLRKIISVTRLVTWILRSYTCKNTVIKLS